MSGIMDFQVEHPETGETGHVDDQYVVQALQQAGAQPLGISADGMTLTLADEQGQYQVGIHDVLKDLGWQVKASMPRNVDYDNVQMPWRMAITKLEDEDAKKAFLESKMRRAGIEQPQVIGGGRDWYVFNPQTSQWIAVTNNPEWDMSDVAEGALEVPRFLGSALGGAAGAGLGGGTPLSIAGASAGAALGGGMIDAASRAALAGYDPDFAAATSLAGQAQDVGINAGIDALAFGGGKALSPLLKGVLPVSKTLQAGGAALDRGGAGLARAAGAFDNPIGQIAAEMGVPGISGASSVGWTLRAPQDLVTGAAKLPGWLGGKIGGRTGQAMQDLSARLTAPRAAAASSGAPQWSRTAAEVLGGSGDEAASTGLRARDVLGNLAEETRRGVGNAYYRHVKPLFMSEAEAANDAAIRQSFYGNMRKQYGMRAQDAHNLAKQEMVDWRIANQMPGVQGAGNFGEHVGSVVDAAAAAGKPITAVTGAAARGAIKGAKGIGTASHILGHQLRGVGTAMAPLEIPAYLRAATEEGRRRYRGGRSNFQGLIMPQTVLASDF